MSTMPVPVDMFFRDFSDELIECSIIRDDVTIVTVKGMPNVDGKKEKTVMFKYGTDIKPGDIVISERGSQIVREIRIDKHNGKPDAVVVLF